jgi:hypothetical protein
MLIKDMKFMNLFLMMMNFFLANLARNYVR